MAEQAVTCGGCTGFTQAVNAIHDGVIQHADRVDPHEYWCQFPDSECICP